MNNNNTDRRLKKDSKNQHYRDMPPEIQELDRLFPAREPQPTVITAFIVSTKAYTWTDLLSND